MAEKARHLERLRGRPASVVAEGVQLVRVLRAPELRQWRVADHRGQQPQRGRAIKADKAGLQVAEMLNLAEQVAEARETG